MSYDFLRDFSFEKLIRPTTPAVFFDRHWEHEPLIIERRAPDFYGDLVTVDDIDHLVATGPKRVGLVPATEDGSTEIEVSQSAVDISEYVFSDLARGGTLVLPHVEDRLPALGMLCRLLGQEFGFVFDATMYVSSPNALSFTTHFDYTDIFVLQLQGSKLWHVERTRRKFPRIGDYDYGEAEMSPDRDDCLLRQGDLFYLPRGFYHTAASRDDASAHIRLRILPPSWEDFIHAAVKLAADENDDLKRALPVGFPAQGGGVLAAGLAERLGAVLSRPDLDRMAAIFINDQVTRFATDTAGQIGRILTAERPRPGDLVGPRRGLIYRRHADGEEVILSIGARHVTFPDVLAEQLDFTLDTPTFAVRDIPGDLSDAEKVVFIERLMQEGIIERKDDVL